MCSENFRKKIIRKFPRYTTLKKRNKNIKKTKT